MNRYDERFVRGILWMLLVCNIVGFFFCLFNKPVLVIIPLINLAGIISIVHVMNGDDK